MKRDIARFRAAYHSSAKDYDHTAHLTTFDSKLPWISAGSGEEWITIDLGTVSRIETVSIRWGEAFAKAYEVLVSPDGKDWLSAGAGCAAADTETQTAVHQSGRYVKLLCRDCSGKGYVVYKIEVFGDNDLAYALPPMPDAQADGTQLLSGGNWRICRAEQVDGDGAALSDAAYDDSGWLPATVPGTALISYLNAGAIPDPDYDDWQFQISEAYFTADFWYRNRFAIPAEKQGRRVYLNFQAINWKADVYFNGQRLKNSLQGREHSIEGAFIRARFDITDLAVFGGENQLAVYIYKNETPGLVTTQGLAFGPGPNGGLLGADNPTMHAAVGWDWLPTIRGRDIGIYGDVTISYSGAAELVDPWIQTHLALLDEKVAVPAENLMLRSGVRIDGKNEALKDWQGGEGDGFVVDFGEALTLGTVTLVWGSEAGGAAADMESRHPEQFSLETSCDGQTWTNFDAYPGGEVDAGRFGKLQADANPGSAFFAGHSIADSVQGGTALAALDLSRFGRGVVQRPFFMPNRVRFLRFTVQKRRELNGKPVDTRIRELLAYAQSPEQVEQTVEHKYVLDTEKADLTFQTEIKNRGDKPISAQLCVKVLPGDVTACCTIEIPAGETLPVELPFLLPKPRLWWPNTYGEQFLYTAQAQVKIQGEVSDEKSFRFGVRRFDYPIDGGLLTLYCNGVRILCKGGNWGIDDGMKRDTARVLDDKVRLHAEQNMTMIRNWVGMTGHPGFYDACDKYGVLIWDDFWLANPVDGPEPNDRAMFLENAADKVRMVRSHPSLALYCGRNEGNPIEELNKGLEELTQGLDGTRIYFPHSASLPVGSGGGYSLAGPGPDKGVKQYFDDVSSSVLRSERGIPNVPALESLQRFLKPEHLWPINEVWALHDWTYHMNGPANTYMYALQSYLGGDFAIPEDHVQGQAPQDSDPVFRQYKADIARMCEEAGKCWTIEDFSKAAQLINYDNHRGMFDALAARRSNGLLMWMSQSSWPSFMWQTYDYYLDSNGGFFGSKAGNQPTRAIFDPRDEGILLANATPKRYENVVTTAELFDLAGKLVSSQTYETELLEADAFGLRLGTADFSAAQTEVVFLRLTLKDSKGTVLGKNTYWHNWKRYQDYRTLRTMAKADVCLQVLGKECLDNGSVRYALRLQNGSAPALGVRVRLLGADGAAVLPVFYSDNYLVLMPEETQVITAEFDPARLCGDACWQLQGWNLAE